MKRPHREAPCGIETQPMEFIINQGIVWNAINLDDNFPFYLFSHPMRSGISKDLMVRGCAGFEFM